MSRGAAIVLAGLVAASFSAASAAVRPVYGGAARIGAEGPIAHGDPARARSDAERLLARATGCTLADVVATTEPVDDDGLRVRLRLRDPLVFHDGTRLTAEDVVRSLERVAGLGAGSPAGWRLLVVARDGEGRLALRATGPLSLELERIAPGIDPVAWLDDPGLAILRADGRTGCGAYRRVEAAGDGTIHLEPFTHHVRGRPFLDALHLVPVPPAASAWQDLATLDGAVGAVAGREGRALGGGRLVLLRLEGRHRGDAGLRLRISEAVDRDGLVRFLVGGRAHPVESLARLVDAEAAAETAAAPAARLPPRLLIGYGVHHPLERRLAERIQVRLHDLGTRVVLAPVDGRGPSGAEISLEVVAGLPAEPGPALVALAHRAGDPGIAREILDVLLSGDEAEDGKAAALAEAARRLEVRLGIVPLYHEPLRLRLAPDLFVGAEAGRDGFDPADLWRWPEGVPGPGRGGAERF